MRVAVIALSDVHFSQEGKCFPLSHADAIAGAVSSENIQLEGLVLILAGDIANSGAGAEYELAKAFIEKLRSAFTRHYPSLELNVIAVPGNHDCCLPEEEVDHRKSQVESSIKTLLEDRPDRVFINHLLQAQQEYWEFLQRFHLTSSGEYSKLWDRKELSFGAKSVRFNLYNSAALSQRNEDRGQLYMPVRMLAREVPRPEGDGIVISVVHHPLLWLEPDNALAFRRHLLRSCDLVFTGHQHRRSSYLQTHETGESLRFFESPALFDGKRSEVSAFRVVTFDLHRKEMKDCVFEWRDELYRPNKQQSDWRPIEMNRAVRQGFEVDPQFMETISDPGVAYISQRDHRRVNLSDLFVYPDLRPNGGASFQRVVRGNEVADALSSEGINLVQGDSFSGKTALARSLFRQYVMEDRQVPVYIDGASLVARDLKQFEKRVRERFVTEYSNADIDLYMQLPSSQRVVIIDDWHLAKLSNELRLEIYSWLRDFAISSILLTDRFYELSRIVTKQASLEDELPTEDAAVSKFEILGLSHVGRGELIHRWLDHRNEDELDPVEVSKESKTTEDEVSRLLGKDSLPPHAFFIICLLQARENRTINRIAGASFGHLYEVLIVSALIKGENNGSQLDRKYALLSEIAAYMWRNEKESISLDEVQEISSSYTRDFLLELKADVLLPGLEAAFVLKKSGSQYEFTYSHFYYYFVARYIRDRIDDAEDSKLSESINYMIDNISSRQNSSIIMFLIYFAKEKRRIINRLVENASSIYAEVSPARLEDDARPFFYRKEEPAAPEVGNEVDVAANRQQERRKLDAKSTDSNEGVKSRGDETFSYSCDLDDSKKLHLADRNLEALGQIIRNFSTTLPEKDKIKVLECAYLLGLRATARSMQLLEDLIASTETLLDLRDEAGGEELNRPSLAEQKSEIDRLGFITGKAIALVFIKKISSSVGVVDMEAAYKRVMQVLPVSYATKLTDVVVQMDHFRSFPESRIIELDREFRGNPFAQGVLRWLVATHLLLYRVDRVVRQKIASQLQLNEGALLKLSLNR